MAQASERLWPDVRILERGLPVVVDTLSVTFFIDPVAAADPNPAATAFAEFLGDLARGKLHFFVNEDGDCQPISGDPAHFVAERLRRQAASGEFVGAHLLDTDLHGDRWEAYYEHNPDLAAATPGKRNFVTFRMDHDRVVEVGVERVVQFFRRLAEILPYTYGYAGPSLAYGEAIRATRPIVRRHPGFDIANPVAVALDLDDHAVGAYWLNALGPTLLQRIGGVEVLAARVPGASVSFLARDGALVRLGEKPDVGDVNRGERLPLYRALASALEPILHVPSVRYLPDDNDPASSDLQIAWHRRFLDG
jgi:hypothetical protein